MRMNRNLPASPPQPAASSAEILALRTNWKWAYLSHFLFTYNPVLHLEDIQLSELEADLASGTFDVIPTVIQRLLMSLTPHDKRMILENWQQQLRKQSLKRVPDHNLMGSEDNPTDFASLIMSDKLDLFHALCEWQFHNPNSLRARMRDDDEYANWRMEPIAYDAKGNAYWLMGGNRLWIQHAPPRKQTAKSHKRKQPATASTNGRKSAKRRQPATISSSTVVAAASATNAKSKAPASSTTGRPIRETRSRAQQTGSSTERKSRAMGTRVSSRLRGRVEEDIWQPIPEEWLKEGKPDGDDENQADCMGTVMQAEMENTLKSLDDVSELTSLSDLSELPEVHEETNDEEDTSDSTPSPTPELSSSSDDVWETVCVTLAEWEQFPQRFEKSTHRAEKAFYKLLVNEIVPAITEVLRVDVRKKVMEEAVVHRKRSSRIAVKESVREAERAETRRRAEEEKEMERHRRWEARARKEEEERVRRENLRSTRLRERGRTGSESVDVDIIGGESESKPAVMNGVGSGGHEPINTTPVKFVVNVSKSGTQTPKDDEVWELDCEICHRRGMNLDDGQALMCCGKCNKWQHIRCHDHADFIAGRQPRNWELVDFLCAACAVKRQSSLSQQQPRRQNQDPQLWTNHNGRTNNGIVPMTSQPVPSKSAYSQASSETSPHSNGRTNYALVQAPLQQTHPTSAVLPTQYAHRPSSSTGQPTLPGAPPRVLAPAPVPGPPPTPARVPYTSGPNMYLSSSYPGGNYRPAQAAAQPLQPSSSSHYRATTQVAPANVWSQQQVHYSQLAGHQGPWNGTAHASGSQLYAASGASMAQSVQQNRYYRPHPPPPASNPLAPPNHLPPAQQYYTGGPSSQS